MPEPLAAAAMLRAMPCVCTRARCAGVPPHVQPGHRGALPAGLRVAQRAAGEAGLWCAHSRVLLSLL